MKPLATLALPLTLSACITFGPPQPINFNSDDPELIRNFDKNKLECVYDAEKATAGTQYGTAMARAMLRPDDIKRLATSCMISRGYVIHKQ